MSSRQPSEIDKELPAVYFDRLCQVMLDGSSNDLTIKTVKDFQIILHMIMHQCSKANIETGKVWVFEHCKTPAHATAILEYILSLSSSRYSQEERIHMIYLVNDLVFHTARKQLPWMRDAMLPLLTPLLKLAYEAAKTVEFKAKVMKVKAQLGLLYAFVITFWNEKNIFDVQIINKMRQDVSVEILQNQHNEPPPPQQQQQQQQMPYFQQQIPFQQQQQAFFQQHYPQAVLFQNPLPFQQQFAAFNPSIVPQQRMQTFIPPPLPPVMYQQQFQTQQQHHVPSNPPITPPPMPVTSFPPSKKYFELPAGFMMLAKNDDYKPINPTVLKGTLPQFTSQKEFVEALDDFYKELDLSTDEDSILDEKIIAESKIDAQGWEKGFLDDYFASVAQKKKEKAREQQQQQRKQESGDRSRSRDRYSRRRSRSRSPSPAHRSSRRRSYSRSRSPPRRRGSPARGRSPSGRRSSPPGRGRSPRRSPPPRRCSPASNHRSRRYSRSRSPPSSFQQSSRGKSSRGDFGGGVIPPENKYMGLGSAPDEYDSFRKNKSQAYNRREPHGSMTCYKCNKPGHLARECQSL